MATYIAILGKEKRSDYGVDFPDLPGCVTAGGTLEEARKNAAEALALHLGGMAEDNLPIPAPSSLDEILVREKHLDGVPFLVEVRDAEPRAVRVNITLPADVLEKIDAYATKIGRTRSALLAEAALARIEAAERRRPRRRRKAA